MRLGIRFAAFVVSAAAFTASAPLAGQSCNGCAGADLPAGLCQFSDPSTSSMPCPASFPVCVLPISGGTRVDILPGGGGNFEARLIATVTAPSNIDPATPDVARLNLYWATGSTPTNPTTSLCQAHVQNRAETYIAETVTCAGAPYDFGLFSLRAIVCEGSSTCCRSRSILPACRSRLPRPCCTARSRRSRVVATTSPAWIARAPARAARAWAAAAPARWSRTAGPARSSATGPAGRAVPAGPAPALGTSTSAVSGRTTTPSASFSIPTAPTSG